ncbi:MAG TPA: sporulation protein YjcZ [Clostridia bacterium]|jgi:hypothetical protein|nr:sporulation protein YjcZ [Clostridia bacterium]
MTEGYGYPVAGSGGYGGTCGNNGFFLVLILVIIVAGLILCGCGNDLCK